MGALKNVALHLKLTPSSFWLVRQYLVTCQEPHFCRDRHLKLLLGWNSHIEKWATCCIAVPCRFIRMNGALLVEHHPSARVSLSSSEGTKQQQRQDQSLVSVVMWYRFVWVFIFGSRNQWFGVACLYCSWNAVCACLFSVLNILI
jgi:hypothetical protein